MSGLTKDDVIRMARETDLLTTTEPNGYQVWIPENLKAFANLVAAAEREKVARWMMTACYATGHGDTTEDLLRELAWQADERIAKAAAAEREACAKVCEQRAADHEEDSRLEDDPDYKERFLVYAKHERRCAKEIRARGSDAT